MIGAIVLAAGQGKRMKLDYNKQFIEIAGRPIIEVCLSKFNRISEIDYISLVVNKNDYRRFLNEILPKFNNVEHENKIQLVIGGKERSDSVYAALQSLPKEIEKVLIHDGARPLIDEETIYKVIEELDKEEACVVGVPAKDTFKLMDSEGYVSRTIERNRLIQVQTPQGFNRKVIENAYEKGIEQEAIVTDDAMMIEKFGHSKIKIVQGKYENIKVTTQEDLFFVESFRKNIDNI